MKNLRKKRKRLTDTKPNSRLLHARAEARARVTQPGDGVPIVNPVFVSAESVRAGAGMQNIRKATWYDGETPREIWRKDGESLEAFQTRVRDSIPVAAARRPIAWSEQ